ncbi:triacylglycerol lipase 2-like isoform X1 [Ziziphus jujuba]|uniref:Lipase n=2 Tax=Ziziphus jujuba TaxID=326968 RepID=A0ABM4A5X9_ZIZJJ|nr:triacylglycerol lipase 2-like isoform X1 [Ziziphus jujuba]
MANISSTTVFIVILLLCVSAAVAATAKLRSPAANICKSLVETQGYICQEHKVTTKDGYVLGVQRIPMGRSANKTANNKPPVLLQHGLLLDAATWLLGSPDEALGFILADHGFDVWLSNTRGTASSRGHAWLNPQDPEYWEWSWDELAEYELPALFEYVYHQTGQKLYYVGHSLGTLNAFVALSKGKLVNMLRSAAMLTPVAYLGQMTSPAFRSIAELFLSEKLYSLGVREFILKGQDVAKLLQFVCLKAEINCSDTFTVITGPNCCIKKSTVDSFLGIEPQSTATKNVIHLSQMIRRGTLTKYDYGNVYENVKSYGQITPPAYNVKSIPKDVPLLLSYGGKDTLTVVNDVKILLEDLRDHKADKLVLQYRDDYAHFDFIVGYNANKLVYDPLIAFFMLH